MRLFHYSCEHALDGIRDSGYTLRPWGVPGLPQLVWLTDLDQPDRDGLGLTMRRITCDRTRWRYEVSEPFDENGTIEPWSKARRTFRPTYVEDLEKALGAQPDHWWISRSPVRVFAPVHVEATPPDGWHRLTLTEMAGHTDGELHGMTKTGEFVGAPDGNGWWRRDA